MMTEWMFPRESIILVGPIHVAVNDVPITNFQVALVPIKQRPTGWSTPTMADGQAYYLASGLAPGRYKVWVKYTAAPEVPVLELDSLVTVT